MMKRRTFRIIFWTVLVTVSLTLLAVWLFQDGCGRSEPEKETVYVTDTIRIEELLRDTVLYWQEKIVWKETKPETVWVSPDTIHVDSIWGRWPESITFLFKRGTRLRFVTLTPADSGLQNAIVKDYVYRVSNDFSIHATGDGFFVKTRRPFWCKFYGGLAGGAGFKVWSDSLMPFVDPYVRAYLGWGPVNVGPAVTLHGIQIRAEATWRF